MARPHEVIDFVHNKVHQANMWSYFVFTAALADGASNAIAIQTGSDDIHLSWRVISSGSALVQFHEIPTITSCATGTPYNMNRYRGGSGANALSSASVGASPNIAAACFNTLLWQGHIPAQSKQTGGGGEVRAETEWILNKDTAYTIAASNAQGATGGVGIYIEYYEY